MNWNTISNKAQLEEINEKSKSAPVLIFKHSTRCPISAMALNRLERKWNESSIQPYFLDLITYREISNEIEALYNVIHQSPQAILIKDGKVVHHSSHNGIDIEELNSIASHLD